MDGQKKQRCGGRKGGGYVVSRVIRGGPFDEQLISESPATTAVGWRQSEAQNGPSGYAHTTNVSEALVDSWLVACLVMWNLCFCGMYRTIHSAIAALRPCAQLAYLVLS